MLREISLEANKNEYLSNIIKRYGYNALPTNVILNKQLPGLGATHCEIMAERDSIIIEPNVPVIQSKAKKHPKVLGVYAGVKDKEISDYFEKQTKNRKIITTPESFSRIKRVFSELNINIWEDFFLLFDECEKLVQDINYRESIEDPMDDFFKFKQKALVSATPIATDDPRLEKQGFANLIIRPNYPYKKEFTLITTNNIAESLSETVAPLKGKVCIFTNSIDTIDSLYRDIPALRKSITFCSPDGTKKLYDWKNRKSEVFITELTQYNFFTARFFSAVDIDCPHKPHVVMISDLYGAPQSVIDPATEAIQIVGRFRNGVKSVTHITSINTKMECMNSRETKDYIEGADAQYRKWDKEREASRSEGQRAMLQEAMLNCSYKQYLTLKGEQNPFKIANFYEDQRVKRLYTSGELLSNNYKKSGFFEVTYKRESHLFSDEDRLAMHRAITKKGRASLLLMNLEKINYLRLSANTNQRRKHENILAKLITNQAASALYDCYIKFGAEFVRGTEFNEKTIARALNRKQDLTIRNSREFKSILQQKIVVGKRYTSKELQAIYLSVCKDNEMFVYKSKPTKELEQFFELKPIRVNNLRMLEVVNIKDNKGKN
nr:hypothetical protein [uncultured Bacteroides sp.]